MGNQATIFVICLILHYVSMVSSQRCRKQEDCGDEGNGLRCVLGSWIGNMVACEQIYPQALKSLCQCQRGCLKCDGGPVEGTSRFFPNQFPVPAGCGQSYCICSDARINLILCSASNCNDTAWLDHCIPL